MTSQEIRQQFLDFFKNKQHKIVPSAPIILKDDPTLMFTNAGMVPFKEYFLGQKKVEVKRIADTQKCLRVSGKHNDLEEVGIDTYHHTMFEMLGNWSFGDYFKKEAIAWAWELLVDVYKINKDNLYVTVFEGAKDENLAFDQEAFDYWKTHIPEDRILKGNKKDNFWEMGDSGPCGPCSEIHIDLRPENERMKIPGKQLVNQGDPLVIEIWNLVFIHYNRRTNGDLEMLPKKNKKGNRFFTIQDIENIKLIYHLVKERGMTLSGAKKKLKENKEDTYNNYEVVQSLTEIKKMLLELKDSM